MPDLRKTLWGLVTLDIGQCMPEFLHPISQLQTVVSHTLTSIRLAWKSWLSHPDLAARTDSEQQGHTATDRANLTTITGASVVLQTILLLLQLLNMVYKDNNPDASSFCTEYLWLTVQSASKLTISYNI